jgi:ABC-type molybdate transport system permease subunit
MNALGWALLSFFILLMIGIPLAVFLVHRTTKGGK